MGCPRCRQFDPVRREPGSLCAECSAAEAGYERLTLTTIMHRRIGGESLLTIAADMIARTTTPWCRHSLDQMVALALDYEKAIRGDPPAIAFLDIDDDPEPDGF